MMPVISSGYASTNFHGRRDKSKPEEADGGLVPGAAVGQHTTDDAADKRYYLETLRLNSGARINHSDSDDDDDDEGEYSELS